MTGLEHMKERYLEGFESYMKNKIRTSCPEFHGIKKECVKEKPCKQCWEEALKEEVESNA